MIKKLAVSSIISKRGYNLNGTVNFLNKSVEVLKKKRIEDQNMVDENTTVYIKENLDKIRIKLDSSANKLNNLKVNEGLYDITNRDEKQLNEIKNLEKTKAELITKINSLNNVRNSVASSNLDNLISLNAAGIEDGMFTASVSELKALYAKRREMGTYLPGKFCAYERNK
ncbi:hypothetical protein [Halpernia sp. GG3]